MFGNFAYLTYTCLFCLPILGILWWKKRSFFASRVRLLFMIAAAGVLFQLISDPFAEAWDAWLFSSDKILGIWVFNFPVENLLFFILVPLCIGSVVLVCVDWKRRGRRRWLVG